MLGRTESLTRHGNSIDVIATEAARPIREEVDPATIRREGRIEIVCLGVEGDRFRRRPRVTASASKPNVPAPRPARAIRAAPEHHLAVWARRRANLGELA